MATICIEKYVAKNKNDRRVLQRRCFSWCRNRVGLYRFNRNRGYSSLNAIVLRKLEPDNSRALLISFKLVFLSCAIMLVRSCPITPRHFLLKQITRRIKLCLGAPVRLKICLLKPDRWETNKGTFRSGID